MKKYILNQCFVPVIFALCVLLTSCKKYLDIPPPINQLVSTSVFENAGTANAAITGIYSEMMNNSQQFTNNYVTFFAGMSADELKFWSPTFREEFEKNNISEINHAFLSTAFWGRAYQYIYAANSCIERLQSSRAIGDSIKRVLISESKFVRAFCYYYLVNLFGDVPLILTTNYEINGALGRTSVTEVYQQITADLQEGVASLPNSYSSIERTRPIRSAAASLLARVYLHQQNWVQAESLASEVISSNNYSLSNDINNVFIKNSHESIWQLQPVNPAYNTWEAFVIVTPANSNPSYILTSDLLNSFEPGDLRKLSWVGTKLVSGQPYYYPYKYKVAGGNAAPVTEYYTVLRLAEVYLVRAEARAHQGNFLDAISDINAIRNRAGLPGVSANSEAALLYIIEKERRVELFAEWGHRWFDLKRTGRADAVLSVFKGLTWNTTDHLWPIPIQQINLNPNLTQNIGY